MLAQSQDKVKPALPAGGQGSWVTWAKPHSMEEMRQSCPREQSEKETRAAAL